MNWVLWVLFLTTWSYHGVPMTPGFAATLLFETRVECVEASRRLIEPTVCMTPDMPDPIPVAMTVTEDEEMKGEDKKKEMSF
jgi:hypothetical protein